MGSWLATNMFSSFYYRAGQQGSWLLHPLLIIIISSTKIKVVWRNSEYPKHSFIPKVIVGFGLLFFKLNHSNHDQSVFRKAYFSKWQWIERRNPWIHSRYFDWTVKLLLIRSFFYVTCSIGCLEIENAIFDSKTC